MKKSFLITLFLSCSLIGCVHNELASENLFASLCGNTYKGAVTSKDPQDEDWRKEVLVLGPVNCIGSERVEMPLAVGSNTSRTWFVTGKGQTLELRHQHLHEDGSPDAVSLYGGPIAGAPRLVGDVWTMSFPADQKTIDIFNAKITLGPFVYENLDSWWHWYDWWLYRVALAVAWAPGHIVLT